ncbi:hypothetical protein [Verticiella sediminum]|uniref:hypothetical protein n=1 Tax=Verticiella sediminum TaxID=1247510 RepID=UPI0014780698|nr:hypothetical protein [Verticiella sediminum]
MTLRLATQTPTYRIKVEVSLPTEKGRFERQDFWWDVRRVDSDELDELVLVKGQSEVIRRVHTAWSGVLGEDGQPLEPTPENLEALLLIPQVRVAMAAAYWSNINDVRQKNL